MSLVLENVTQKTVASEKTKRILNNYLFHVASESMRCIGSPFPLAKQAENAKDMIFPPSLKKGINNDDLKAAVLEKEKELKQAAKKSSLRSKINYWTSAHTITRDSSLKWTAMPVNAVFAYGAAAVAIAVASSNMDPAALQAFSGAALTAASAIAFKQPLKSFLNSEDESKQNKIEEYTRIKLSQIALKKLKKTLFEEKTPKKVNTMMLNLSLLGKKGKAF